MSGSDWFVFGLFLGFCAGVFITLTWLRWRSR